MGGCPCGRRRYPWWVDGCCCPQAAAPAGLVLTSASLVAGRYLCPRRHLCGYRPLVSWLRASTALVEVLAMVGRPLSSLPSLQNTIRMRRTVLRDSISSHAV
ncbi:hypothetical protein BHM03_00036483 [Ensete ventricosum]|uniref:Uncharacterized protein n=1 Tax=Ensete ventricosum TaxID=4639 RepID=A0A445MJG1_ENSVE|nr:hypothetical protein BHM03_00036483 [Ensete ventricosum]